MTMWKYPLTKPAAAGFAQQSSMLITSPFRTEGFTMSQEPFPNVGDKV